MTSILFWVAFGTCYAGVGIFIGRVLAEAQVAAHHRRVKGLQEGIERIEERGDKYTAPWRQAERTHSTWTRRARLYAGRALWTGILFWPIVAAVATVALVCRGLAAGTRWMIPKDVEVFPLTERQFEDLERRSLR